VSQKELPAEGLLQRPSDVSYSAAVRTSTLNAMIETWY